MIPCPVTIPAPQYRRAQPCGEPAEPVPGTDLLLCARHAAERARLLTTDHPDCDQHGCGCPPPF